MSCGQNMNDYFWTDMNHYVKWCHFLALHLSGVVVGPAFYFEIKPPIDHTAIPMRLLAPV